MSKQSEQRFAGRVVVGVDGSDVSREAISWGARQAQGRGVGLTLVQSHSVVSGMTHPPGHLSAVVASQVADLSVIEDYLAEQARECRRLHPELDVTWHVDRDVPASTLARASRSAVLIVIGSNRRGPLDSVLVASTTGRLAADAECPMVVVPQDDPEWSAQPVVLATDGSSNSADAARFAFETAQMMGVGVTALMACDLSAMRRQAFAPPSDALLRACAAEQLEASLAPHRAEFPDVEVQVMTVDEDPVQAIRLAASSASLLVCGSRGQGYLRGTMFGSTGRDTLRTAERPAAVVRPSTLQQA